MKKYQGRRPVHVDPDWQAFLTAMERSDRRYKRRALLFDAALIVVAAAVTVVVIAWAR